ncbi:hypothetical protein [Micromonospora sp. LOL_023]|uniref:hypothetical protein n=1 Tax=Micromonospora sp. LOL_023 TaxID=3345418 RepID=UPI003A837ABD
MSEPERIAFILASVTSPFMSGVRHSYSLLATADQFMTADRPADVVAFLQEAVKAGNHRAVTRMVNLPDIWRNPEAQESVYRAAVAAGDQLSLTGLASVRARLGDTAEARRLYLRAIEVGVVWALTAYAVFLRNHGGPGEADRVIEQCRRQVEAGDVGALPLLGALLLVVPDHQAEAEAEAEAVLRQGAAMLENRCRCLLAVLLLERGSVGEATELIERLQATGDEYVRVYVEDLIEEYDLHPGSDMEQST